VRTAVGFINISVGFIINGPSLISSTPPGYGSAGVDFKQAELRNSYIELFTYFLS